jgi:hypothetical protein
LVSKIFEKVSKKLNLIEKKEYKKTIFTPVTNSTSCPYEIKLSAR